MINTKITNIPFSFFLHLFLFFNILTVPVFASSGCDDSLDTASNSTSPGNLIPALDHVDSNTTTCLSGDSDDTDNDNKRDYYHFTTGAAGQLHIVTSSPNSHEYHMEITSDKQGTLLDYDTAEDRDLYYTVVADEEIIIYIKETGDDLDEYQITITFTKSDYTESSDSRTFTIRHQENLFGDVEVIGNTVLCVKNNSGVCISDATHRNNYLDLQRTTSSYSTLTLPENATIKYARLYWQGRYYKNHPWNAERKAKARVIKFKAEADTNWQTLTADTLDLGYDGSRPTYAATADVTEYIKDKGASKYYVDTATFYTITGATSYYSDDADGLGTFGAWVLVVVYQDEDTLKAKNITIFDGYQIIDGSNAVEIPITGFLTPKSNTVDSAAYLFVGEGDKHITGDDLLLKGETKHTNYTSIAPDSDNAFNSRIDVPAVRSPNLINNNGIDIQYYNIGTSDGGKGIIDNNEVGATFKLTTGGDVYFPSLVVFSTELYLPRMCYDFSVKQDGAYLKLNRDEYPEPIINDRLSPSDIEITVYLKNQEADFPAENIALKSDVNDSIFFVNKSSSGDPDHIYVSNVNGAKLIDRGTLDYANPLPDYDKNTDYSADNQGLTNGHDILKGIGSLDAQEYIYTKYTLHPNDFSGFTDINESLGLSVSFYITANGSKIDYTDYLLGSEKIPLCPPSDAYIPQWGLFNVVEHGQTTNNIRTQISRKPFDADVIFDSEIETGTNDAPSGDINTTVLVEIIDIDAFGDLNASCAKPDSAVTAPIYLGLHYTHDDYQQLITPQSADYYNFAVKNAAFRVWYFTDNNSTLIQNWTATTALDSANKTLLSISGLYDSKVHTACTTECDASPNSTNCFECIFKNYAKPLCSRDNFSVRPESYDVRIYDNNQSSVETDPKNDLSVYYGYDTSSSSTPSTRMQLAAGYDYRFDINSTGHDNTQRTPGYTRYFTGASDFNATLIWDSSLADTSYCNNTENQNIVFYIRNGIMTNQERNSSNVGEYKLNITDTSWTAVDWDPALLSHHSDSSFVSGADCITNSTSSSLVGGKYGCTISTNHGTDGNGHYYRDSSIFFHPYRFDLNGTTGSNPIFPSYSTNFTVLGSNNYIYYADINNSDDENMSYHIDGSIVAAGANGIALNNFVNQCYAKPIKISIKTSDRTLKDSNGNDVAYVVRFHDMNTSGEVDQALDINYSNSTTPTADIVFETVQTATKGYFPKSFNGKTEVQLNLNYARQKNVPINPKELSFFSFTTECKNAAADCTFSSDLVHNKTTKAVEDLNSSLKIKHYYGRTHNPRQSFDKNASTTYTDAADLIYYEVYCAETTCDKTLLQNGITSKFSDDPRWFINENHLPSFGLPGHANQKGYSIGSGYVKEIISPTGVYPDFFGIRYDGTRGYPYKTTMENNASGWLIYNKYNPAATKNSWDVEFTNASGNWAGVRETNTTTKRNASDKTNRRTLW